MRLEKLAALDDILGYTRWGRGDGLARRHRVFGPQFSNSNMAYMVYTINGLSILEG